MGVAQPSDDHLQAKGEHHDDDSKEAISLDTAPEAVRATAIKIAGNAKNITKVTKEEDEDATEYEIEYNEGTVKCPAVFSSNGDLMETEKEIGEGKVPVVVMVALKKEFLNATFADHTLVTKVLYEVDIIINGKKHEVKVNAAGDIKNEHRHQDDKEEHEENEEHKGKKHEHSKH